MVHDVKGTPVLFAGSKNTCFAWRGDADVTAAFPAATSQAGAYVPGPRIAAAMQQIWQGWSQVRCRLLCTTMLCTLMLLPLSALWIWVLTKPRAPNHKP